MLELTEDVGAIVDHVPAGHVFVDGRRQWDSDSRILDERRRLGRDGVVTISVAVGVTSGVVVNPPEVLSSGFVEMEESGDLVERTAEKVSTTLERHLERGLGFDEVKSGVQESVASFLYDETRQRPLVFVHLERV